MFNSWWWSHNTIDAIFKKLRKKGIVQTAKYNQRKNDKTLWYSLNYNTLESRTQFRGSQKPNLGVKDDPCFGATLPLEFKELKSINTKSDLLTGDTCLTFSQFYDMYDRKKDAPKAKAAFAKTTEPERELIKAHVPLYVASTQGDNKKYRKYPHRYLQQQGWLNEIDQKPTEATKTETTIKTQADYIEEFLHDAIDSIPTPLNRN